MTNTITTKSRLRGQDFVTLDDLNIPITLIGAGSIGSFTALGLTKMGCQDLTVFDFDTVDEVNVGCQLYGMSDLNKDKPTALNEIINRLADISLVACCRKWDGATSPIMISALDSMETRREVWEAIKSNIKVDWYIDGRMAGEYMHILTVNMSDKNERAFYEKSLEAKEVEQLSCSNKGIVYNTLIIGGLITQQVKRIAKKEPFAREIIFDLPVMGLIASVPQQEEVDTTH